jgi:hypothetical protein
VMAGHDGNHGGVGFRQKERRCEWGVKAGLITIVEGGGRSGGVKASGCYGRRDLREVEGEADRREVEGGSDGRDPPVSETARRVTGGTCLSGRGRGEWERIGPGQAGTDAGPSEGGGREREGKRDWAGLERGEEGEKGGVGRESFLSFSFLQGVTKFAGDVIDWGI